MLLFLSDLLRLKLETSKHICYLSSGHMVNMSLLVEHGCV